MSRTTKGIGAGLVVSALLLLIAVSPAAAQGIYGYPMGQSSSFYGQPMMQHAQPQSHAFSFRQPFVRFRVQFGDTLSGIARSFGVSQRALLKVNPQIEDPDLIFAGQKLIVPVHVFFFHRGY